MGIRSQNIGPTCTYNFGANPVTFALLFRLQVYARAAAPGVIKPGGPLPPDRDGNRRIGGAEFVWPRL
jgi:hypothetical protein